MAKKYKFGVATVCPTDCTLYVTDGEIYKEFLVESESWKMVSALMDYMQYRRMTGHLQGNETKYTINDSYSAAAIVRHLLYSDTKEDECSDNQVEKTEENIEKLAKEAVSQLDMDGLIDYAEAQLEAYYETLAPEDFDMEWVQVFDINEE